MNLQQLVAKAINLAGGNTCAAGHDWQSDGGRACPRGGSRCSQAVYRCARCGIEDYGDPGGPGHEDCSHERLCSGEDEPVIACEHCGRVCESNDDRDAARAGWRNTWDGWECPQHQATEGRTDG